MDGGYVTLTLALLILAAGVAVQIVIDKRREGKK